MKKSCQEIMKLNSILYPVSGILHQEFISADCKPMGILQQKKWFCLS